MNRKPAVAGQFYPDNGRTLSSLVQSMIADTAEKRDVVAIVSPHAGYVYSGGVAGEVFSKINVPNDVIILGPNHHGLGHPVAVYASGSWETPIGIVAINSGLAEIVLQQSRFMASDVTAHLHEHSLEVQVPFLQHLNPQCKIVPICVSGLDYASCREVGLGLAQAIKEYGRPVLIVASSDMTHFESQSSAQKKDQLAIDRILAMDPEGLLKIVRSRGITMCGVIPTTIALVAAINLGATKAELVKYATSGEVAGDYARVVGYAGLTIY
ncbi:MAG: AmmeMemoRadiSam system protein B [Deltaproteobacteria bacterium]|nr:AmmeMemoRadiSam system protein B [Deltaproteobacteria bacterium]